MQNWQIKSLAQGRGHTDSVAWTWQRVCRILVTQYDKAFCHSLLNFAHSCFVRSFIQVKSCPHQKDKETRLGSVSCGAGWDGGGGVTKKKRLKLRWWDNVSEVPSSEPFIDAGLLVRGARETLRQSGAQGGLVFLSQADPCSPAWPLRPSPGLSQCTSNRIPVICSNGLWKTWLG